MKRTVLPIIIKIMIMMCMCLNVSIIQAQHQGYRWGKWVEGQHGSGTGILLDQVIDSYIDSLGNTYIYGSFGMDARLGANGPYISHMDSISGYLRTNNAGVFLTKIDTSGRVEWCKSARNGNDSGIYPWNMVVKDNTITIAFSNINGSGMWNWFYFFDTMLIDYFNQFHYGDTRTYFVTFDFDGNRVDYHDMQLYSFIDRSIRQLKDCIIGGIGSRFAFDDDNNIHLFACGSFYGGDSVNQSYIIIDGDTNRRYSFNMNKLNGEVFTTAVHYTIDSNWNLINYRFLIDSITQWQANGSSFSNLFVCNLIIQGDEIYLNCIFKSANYDYTPSSYPIKIYLDSVHFIRIDNNADWGLMPCLIKMNRNGDVLWTQQLYVSSSDITNYCDQCGYVAIDGENVYNFYLPSWGQYERFYLDSSYQTLVIGGLTNFCLIVSYDRITGDIESYYLTDSINQNESKNSLVVTENELLINVAFDLLKTTALCKINKRTHEVKKEAPIVYSETDIEIKNMSVSDKGWVFRGETGLGPLVYDSIPVGNLQMASVMTFFYDSALDTRRPKPCPSVDSLRSMKIIGHDVYLSWSGDGNHPRYEVTYTSDSSDWDNAIIFETSDTSVVITLPNDKCHYFRVRGKCEGNRRRYSPLSETIKVCPRIGFDNVEQNSSIELYPNPIRQYVNIRPSDKSLKERDGKYTATISDLTGRSEEVNLTPIGIGLYTLDLSSFPQAVYLLTLTTSDGTQHTVKLNKITDRAE